MLIGVCRKYELMDTVSPPEHPPGGVKQGMRHHSKSELELPIALPGVQL